jgi:hypothetical protein
MVVRFEDHSGFQRACGLLALGGGAMAAVLPWTAPAAAVGAALALGVGPRFAADSRRRWIALVAACALVAVEAALAPTPWLSLAQGGLLALLLAVVRADRARQSGTRPPMPVAVALAIALGAVASLLATSLLPALAEALARAAPAVAGRALWGALLGLWVGLSAAPLHVELGGEPVEARLLSLRASLGAELRPLAERAVAAWRGARVELPEGARADLRASLDALAMAALDLSARCADLARAASPAVEDELERRCSALAGCAEAAHDEAARQSYLRAAEALAGQLEHLRRVLRARERALARLHEEVANLERARFSLTLLRGAEHAAELDLLQQRLEQGTLVFEETVPLPAPVRAAR